MHQGDLDFADAERELHPRRFVADLVTVFLKAYRSINCSRSTVWRATRLKLDRHEACGVDVTTSYLLLSSQSRVFRFVLTDSLGEMRGSIVKLFQRMGDLFHRLGQEAIDHVFWPEW